MIGIALCTGVARADAPKPAPVNLLVSVPTTVAVSSTVDNAKIVPEHLVDGNPKTAWNSRTNDLVGAWLAIRVPGDTQLTSIKLTAGFTTVDPKLGDLFTQDPRIKKLRVTRAGATLRELTLDPESRALQEMPLRAPGGDLKLTIVEVVPGSRKAWREACASELEVWGTLGAGVVPKQQRPTVRVGSLDAPPVLSKAGCLKTVFPTARGGRIGPEPDADTISSSEELAVSADVMICRIDHKQPNVKDITVEIAAVKRTTHAVLDKRSISIDVFASSDDLGDEDSVAISLFPLTRQENAILIHETDRQYGPMHDAGTTSSSLYRIGSTGLEEILTFESTWSMGESSTGDHCRLRDVAPSTRLPKQLVLDCEASYGHWHDPDQRNNGLDLTQRIEKYAWDGTRYARK